MPPARENRNHPRARVDQIAEVELRTPRNRRVQATIHSASANGLGLSLIGSNAEDVQRGRTVTVHFALGSEPVQLPAKVAWHRPGPAGANAGVLVHLEIAGSAMRTTYFDWIARSLQMARR